MAACLGVVEFTAYNGLCWLSLVLLGQGLLITYMINAVLAYNSVGEAIKREQSVFFWALKCFALGGLAHNELLLLRVKKQATL